MTAKQQYELSQAQFEVDVDTWRKSTSKRGVFIAEKPTRPKEPTMGQVMTTNATMEALVEVLSSNRRGVLLHQDEMAAWVASMNQYKGGRGTDRQNWCSFWSGSLVLINRKGQEPIYLESPFIGVDGAIPPQMLADLSDERGRQDGFIHRILFSFPDPLPPGEWSEVTVPKAILDEMSATFDLLWELVPTQNEEGALQPIVVQFSEMGKQFWVDWFNSHQAEQRPPEFPDHLRGPWSKMKSYCARLALILHLCRHACGEATSENIDEVSVAYAAELVDYFKSHARRVYAHLRATPDDKRIAAAVAWIGRQPGRATTSRSLLNAHVGNVKNSRDARQLLGQLEERGYGKTQSVSGRGGSSLRFTLAPVEAHVKGE